MENMPKKSGIYQIRNLVNGKIYVGSAVNLRKRMYNHLNNLKHNKHCNIKLQNAYNKYGENNLVFEIIELVPDKEQLLDQEQYYIDTLNTVNEGYNICPTAGNQLGLKHTLETKIKMRNAKLGKPSNRKGGVLSNETKLKISQAKKGQPSHMKGKHHTDEAKQKNREAHLGKGLKPVLCIELNQIYSCREKAVEALNIKGNGKGITSCCCGFQKSAYGFHWKYVDDTKA